MNRSIPRWPVGVAALMAACLERPSAQPVERLNASFTTEIFNNGVDSVDLLFVVDNSNSMLAYQQRLGAQFRVLIEQLVDPPDDPATGQPSHPPVKSLHVGVVSSDLGTPGANVGSCNVSPDVGDDGLLNPVRSGRAMAAHRPWTTLPAGTRPARCADNPNQYPSFLTFDADSTDAAEFRDDFVCNAFLSTGGCGLEQQLESAYRALVVHNPREQAGNTDPNAGFVRPDAVLGIVVISDEEDGSVRDCRYAEAGQPCTDALSVYDLSQPGWGDDEDLNLRFYTYTPGSAQDPTWPIERYIDPRNPNRGFTSLKPGHPDRVVFAGIIGVPLQVPTRGAEVDWDRLLGTTPQGADAIEGDAAEGPFTMRPNRREPACPGSAMMPACRQEGTRFDAAAASCSNLGPARAWPSRRIAEVARRFDTIHQTGTVASICALDYAPALRQIVDRIGRSLGGRCLPRALPTVPSAPVAGETVRVSCVVRETLSAGSRCDAVHGRRPAERTTDGREVCLVDQVPVALGEAPPAGAHGFYYDTRPDPRNPSCVQRIAFTDGDSVPSGARAQVDCVALASEPPGGVSPPAR
ncbi:MAG: hypothetical protein Q8S73_31800 [Deltaproteobacteria bacterium]|nr:hypothetical protein [Myxococcales bacterium]MDP3218732.1 hypothetical protein [Deltaproteobacteria bacterium]